MKPNHTPIIVVAILLAAAIAVSSSPFHDGWVVKHSSNLLTGAVASSSKLGASTVNPPESAKLETTVDIKPGFWNRFFTEIFGEIETSDTPEDTTSTDTSSGCCADQQAAIDDLIGTVNDMQGRIDVLENRMNQPCSSTTITSGSCDTACGNRGFKCTGAMTVRWEVESHIIGANSESVLRTETADCDYDWYMNFPEVYDERSCFCC